jgi:hypothetical protein
MNTMCSGTDMCSCSTGVSPRYSARCLDARYSFLSSKRRECSSRMRVSSSSSHTRGSLPSPFCGAARRRAAVGGSGGCRGARAAPGRRGCVACKVPRRRARRHAGCPARTRRGVPASRLLRAPPLPRCSGCPRGWRRLTRRKRWAPAAGGGAGGRLRVQGGRRGAARGGKQLQIGAPPAAARRRGRSGAPRPRGAPPPAAFELPLVILLRRRGHRAAAERQQHQERRSGQPARRCPRPSHFRCCRGDRCLLRAAS